MKFYYNFGESTMNMTKIAKLAGCSLSTVSKAFRNSPEISEETRNKIFEIAKQNNCFDNIPYIE